MNSSTVLQKYKNCSKVWPGVVWWPVNPDRRPLDRQRCRARRAFPLPSNLKGLAVTWSQQWWAEVFYQWILLEDSSDWLSIAFIQRLVFVLWGKCRTGWDCSRLGPGLWNPWLTDCPASHPNHEFCQFNLRRLASIFIKFWMWSLTSCTDRIDSVSPPIENGICICVKNIGWKRS